MISDDGLDLILTSWRSGRSASEISRELRERFSIDKTRNAVIGIIHRHYQAAGMAPRSAASKPAKARPQRRTVAPAFVVKVSPPRGNTTTRTVVIAQPGADDGPIDAKTILELRPRDCRFPVGSATGFQQRFCSCPAPEGQPYCPRHATIAAGPSYDRRAPRDAPARHEVKRGAADNAFEAWG